MTRDPATLRLLLERVESATGADRHADVLLWALDRGLTLEWQGNTLVAGKEGAIGWRDPGKHSENFYTNRAAVGPGSIPPYTASVDAALALIERVLPGWGWLVMSDPENETSVFAGLAPPGVAPLFCEGKHRALPALALLAALLRAKIEEIDNL